MWSPCLFLTTSGQSLKSTEKENGMKQLEIFTLSASVFQKEGGMLCVAVLLCYCVLSVPTIQKESYCV